MGNTDKFVGVLFQLVEYPQTPQWGDLVKSARGWVGIFGQHENSYPDECTVVEPWGYYMDGKIEDEDFPLDILCLEENSIRLECQSSVCANCRKIAMKPEEFNYEEVIKAVKVGKNWVDKAMIKNES